MDFAAVNHQHHGRASVGSGAWSATAFNLGWRFLIDFFVAGNRRHAGD